MLCPYRVVYLPENSCNVEISLGKLSRFDPHPQPLSQFWERGANSLVPLLPSWEKGLGDEGETPPQNQFVSPLSPLNTATSSHEFPAYRRRTYQYSVCVQLAYLATAV